MSLMLEPKECHAQWMKKISTFNTITENVQNTKNKKWTLKDSREREKKPDSALGFDVWPRILYTANVLIKWKAE